MERYSHILHTLHTVTVMKIIKRDQKMLSKNISFYCITIYFNTIFNFYVIVIIESLKHSNSIFYRINSPKCQ